MAKRARALADKLRKAREKLGLTKTAAAEAAGFTLTYWSMLEAGERDPMGVFLGQREQLEKIAAAVGLTLDDLVEEE